MDKRDLIVGVDGGNTKTVAMVCDLAGRALGFARGGCGNWEVVGEQGAAALITEVIEQALAMAGRSRREVVHAHMGLAGVDWPEDEPRMGEALVAAGWECEITLENDSFSVLRACTPAGHGIGVTAGTGVASAIVRPDGEKYFYGAFTDLGGGFSIDGQTLHAVIRSGDGRGPQTKLTTALLAATGHESIIALVYDLHRNHRSVSSRVIRPVVFATAAKGDPTAVEIVTRYARQLALCATNLIRRYGLDQEAVPVVAGGTLFTKTGPLLFEVFQRGVKEAAARAQVILADQPPLMGAVRGALSGSGKESPDVWGRIKEEVAAKGWLREDLGLQAKGEDDAEE